MQRDNFFAFLDASLMLIADEAPVPYRALAETVDGMRARLVADGMARIIWFDDGRPAIFSNDLDADIEVEFERPVIMDLIDGHLTLEEAFYQERLRIRGSVEIVERFYEGLLLYFEGAIRSPGVPDLLAQYRDAEEVAT